MKKLAILLIILILALAACGGGSDDSDSGSNSGNEQTATEVAPTDEPADATEVMEASPEADMTEEAMEATAEMDAPMDATEEAMEQMEATAEMDATEESDVEMDATEEAAEDMEATEEADVEMDATEEASDTSSGGPVTISGFTSFEEGCPTLFQFQYPPSWTITRSGGARVTFEVALDSGVSEGLIEYRGGIAPNQIETSYQRFADLDTTTLVYTMNFDGAEFPVYLDERSGSRGPVEYYYFFLPGRTLADNVRMTLQPTDGGEFPPQDEMVQVFSSIIPNSCF